MGPRAQEGLGAKQALTLFRLFFAPRFGDAAPIVAKVLKIIHHQFVVCAGADTTQPRSVKFRLLSGAWRREQLAIPSVAQPDPGPTAIFVDEDRTLVLDGGLNLPNTVGVSSKRPASAFDLLDRRYCHPRSLL